jgi:hypothetical protein
MISVHGRWLGDGSCGRLNHYCIHHRRIAAAGHHILYVQEGSIDATRQPRCDWSAGSAGMPLGAYDDCGLWPLARSLAQKVCLSRGGIRRRARSADAPGPLSRCPTCAPIKMAIQPADRGPNDALAIAHGRAAVSVANGHGNRALPTTAQLLYRFPSLPPWEPARAPCVAVSCRLSLAVSTSVAPVTRACVPRLGFMSRK